MIGYYAEITPKGSCVQALAVELPCEITPTPGDPANTLVPIDAPPEWNPATPTQELRLFNGRLQWVEVGTLEQARANAWSVAKAARDRAEAADFDYGGVLYQPDVAKITGAVLAALLPRPADVPPFSIDWTVSDNSVVTLNAAQVIGLGLTLTARINAIHGKGRELRTLIDNAATPAEAYAHTWESLHAE
jgi:hypothetical protein